jgi:hypothetical protein
MPRWQRPLPEMPAEPGATRNGHKSEAERVVSVQLSEARLAWQKLKNEEKERELQIQLGTLVELEVIKKQVLAANYTVKQQVLAVIERANLPRDAKIDLRHKLVEVLKDLAFEHQHKDTGG